MSVRMQDWFLEVRSQLAHEPVEERVRARIGGTDVVDSTRAMLVWEPRRVVPSYAVPVWDLLRGDLTPAPRSTRPVSGILHPGIPFGVHTSPGDPFDLTVDGRTLEQAVFKPADPDLDGYLLLDFKAFDEWLVEDEPQPSHPREPYHRVETRRSSRLVRIELDGVLLAESRRPLLVFETHLPTRFYLPAEDVIGARPDPKRTVCGYKGEASYWTFDVNGREVTGLAWSYAEPLPGVERLRGLIGFYDDVLDVTVDGRRRERPRTATSKVLLEEFGVEV